MISILLLLSIPILLWIVQCTMLWRARLPIRWRIDQRGLSERLRIINRAITQGCLLLVILIYPALIGQSALIYYSSLLPSGPRVPDFGIGFALAATFLAALFLAWL